MDGLGRIFLGELVLLLFLGWALWASLRLGFPQFGRLGAAFNESWGALKERSRQVSSAQAALLALCANLGSAHLLGAVGAVLLGGPGALLWLWLAYGLGTVFKLMEATLAMHFRRRFSDGSVSGGPLHYIRYYLGTRYRAWSNGLALLLLLVAFGYGNLAQSSAVGTFFRETQGWPPALLGLLLSGVVLLGIAGGVVRLTQVAPWLVALKLSLLLLSTGALLTIHSDGLLESWRLIVSSAFNLPAFAGGALGAAMLGLLEVARAGTAQAIMGGGLGLGVSGLAHAQAQVDHPVRQGLWAIVESAVGMLVSSVVMLAFVASGLWKGFAAGKSVEAISGLFGALPFGLLMLSVLILLFAVSSMLVWGFYAEESAAFVLGEGSRPLVRLCFAAVAFGGALFSSGSLTPLVEVLLGLLLIVHLWLLPRMLIMVRELWAEFFSGKPWQEPRFQDGEVIIVSKPDKVKA